MFVKLKPFAKYIWPFVFLSSVVAAHVFEAQWHMSDGSAELVAAMGNMAVLVIFNLLRHSREGRDSRIGDSDDHDHTSQT